MAGKAGDTIIVAVDGSSYSEEAFQWYVDHMHKPGNKVILLHCMEMPSLPSRDPWEQQTKAGRQKAQDVQEKYFAIMREHKVEAEFIMDFEKPGEYIVSTAKKEKATVIIMGTRGMGKIRRTILGSVSNYVINHADCPVLVCRKTN